MTNEKKLQEIQEFLISIKNMLESKYILSGLKKVRVPGRSELIENDRGLTIMIDYAHSENS